MEDLFCLSHVNLCGTLRPNVNKNVGGLCLPDVKSQLMHEWHVCQMCHCHWWWYYILMQRGDDVVLMNLF